jgi:hypothetical protein
MPLDTVSSPPTVRTQLNLAVETLEALQQLAKASNTSVAELVRAAISTDRLLRETVDQGGRVLIIDRHGVRREVVIPK